MSEIQKRQLSFKKGDVLFREGEPGDIFYFIISGSVGIFHDYEGLKIPLAVIEKTQAVGDLSVINKNVRSATAVALTDLKVIPIQRTSVDEQLALSPRWFQTVVTLLVGRLRAANDIISRNRIKDPKVSSKLESASAAGATRAKKVDPNAVPAAAREPGPQPALRLKKGEVLFREGEPGEFFCFILKGEIGVFRDYDDKRVPLATLDEHQVIGEMSMLDGKSRSATAVALSDVELMKITKKGFDEQLAHQRLWFRALIQTLVTHLRHADELICGSGVHDSALAAKVREVYSDPVFRVRGSKVPALDETRTLVEGSGEGEDSSTTEVKGDGKDLVDGTETKLKGAQKDFIDARKTALKGEKKDLVDAKETLVKAGPAAEKPKLIRITGKHRTVLVCDSDTEFLSKVSELLTKAKIAVLTCSTVGQAQTKLANQKFGCLLINLRMKTGNAEKVVRRIRHQEGDGDEHMQIYLLVSDAGADAAADTAVIANLRDAIDGTFSSQLGANAIAEHVTGMFSR